jgi:hypothetical protein
MTRVTEDYKSLLWLRKYYSLNEGLKYYGLNEELRIYIYKGMRSKGFYRI